MCVSGSIFVSQSPPLGCEGLFTQIVPIISSTFFNYLFDNQMGWDQNDYWLSAKNVEKLSIL